MKKSRLLGAVCACATALVLSTSVNASIISGVQTTAGGKTVDLQGLEWLSIDTTMGLSRNEVNGLLDTIDGGGWSYASDIQTSTLLQSLYGGIQQGLHSSNLDGASWFGVNFFNTSSEYDLYFFYGSDSDIYCYDGKSTHCRGNVAIISGGGWFFGSAGLETQISTALENDATARPNAGSLLVRVSTVPVPAAVWLFGSGLLGLVGMARRNNH